MGAQRRQQPRARIPEREQHRHRLLAGLAALLARANGNPIRTPYIYSRPEWTALVVRKDSPIRTLADLKGKKIAATKGTDPYLFLLRALHTAGLRRADIEHVSLQHADGRVALEQGRSMPGPGSIRTWPPANWKAARACCTGTWPSIPTAS
jgi:ABC-type nitrate/sulfonate/bicarbonate transport system substrate-binding protein